MFTAVRPPSLFAYSLHQAVAPILYDKIIDPDSYHITLHFLGDEWESNLHDTIDTLQQLAFTPTLVTLAGATCFSSTKDHYLTLQMRDNGTLKDHAKQHATALPTTGRWARQRRFSYNPHITLMRSKNPIPESFCVQVDEAVRDLSQHDFVADSYWLLGSTGSPGGPYRHYYHFTP